MTSTADLQGHEDGQWQLLGSRMYKITVLLCVQHDIMSTWLTTSPGRTDNHLTLSPYSALELYYKYYENNVGYCRSLAFGTNHSDLGPSGIAKDSSFNGLDMILFASSSICIMLFHVPVVYIDVENPSGSYGMDHV